MFESLMCFIPNIRSTEIGKWIVDRENDGSPEHPIRLPYVSYDRVVSDFVQAVYRFVDEHKAMELTRYGELLEEAGLKWSLASMSKADVSALDGRTVMALMVGAIRSERFCDGSLLGFFENGSIMKWLIRLRRIDER